MTTIRPLLAALFLAAPILLTACATQQGTPTDGASVPSARTTALRNPGSIPPAQLEAALKPPPGADAAADRAKIFKGTGIVVKGQTPGGGLPPGPAVTQAGGGVVLNFEGAELREVVRNILGDILNESYTIDPAVGGQVTIRTATGIPRDALPATVEMLLRMNGAAMVKEGGIYKIVPGAAVLRGNLAPQLGNSQRALPQGYSVQIVPLRYVGVREMLRLLEPFAKDAQAIRPDELRNLLVLAGTELELRHLLDAIDMFDVDFMSGMSAGVFTLQSADVKTVMAEFDKVFGDRNASPLSGILKIVPIERMNALLVITPQPAYLEEARKWIERLDRGGSGDGQRFYVYTLQNQRAERLAPLLQQAFTGRVTPGAAPAPPTLAPGTPVGTIVSPPVFTPGGINAPAPAPAPAPAASGVAGGLANAQTAAAIARAAGEGLGIVRNIQAVADKDMNTILIVATAAEYSVIEAALKKLDQPSRQVLVEITIAEVALTDDFKFGVEWYFTNGGRSTGGLFAAGTNPGLPASATTTPNTGTVGLLPKVPGFNWLLAGGFPGGIQAALTLLGTAGNTRVIANPHIAALDNQKATIKVGNKIPINQQTVVGGTTSTVTTTAQYIDTGVLVALTPHINAGGLVQLDVQAEVSIPGTVANVGDAPPINTRSIQSLLSVQSGSTMVMGGLITDTKGQSSSGLPLLSKIPILGGLFGQQEIKNDRTELVLFITPRVMDTESEMRGVMEDLRRRMERLDDVFGAVTRQPSAGPPDPGAK
ncbi:MAG: type II secretion system secretin GspD [Betaproteobacteria bacterium]